MSRATLYQRNIGMHFCICSSLHHTVNVEKAKVYFAWLNSEGGRLDRFMDSMDAFRMRARQREWMECREE